MIRIALTLCLLLAVGAAAWAGIGNPTQTYPPGAGPCGALHLTFNVACDAVALPLLVN